MKDLAQDSGKYLSALRNLHSLKLYNIRLEHISGDKFRTYFSAFRETLTSLSLENFATSFSAFVTLVDYFPNVTTLQLRLVEPEPDEGPVPSLSRPLQGKLHVHEVHVNYLKFFNQFAQLELEYEELVIDTSLSTPAGTLFVESALRISPSTVKSLRLTMADLECGYPLSVLLTKIPLLPNPPILTR